jgi:hypothetical protein
MALLFTEGFDWTTTLSELTRKWTALSSQTGMSIETSSPLTGAGSLSITASLRHIEKTVASSATLISGVRIKPTTLGGQPITFLDSATIQVDVLLNTNGTLSARRGGSTVLGTTVEQVVFLNTNHYIEAKVLFSDTVGTVDVHVDGVSVLSLTSQDTKQSANATASTVRIGSFALGLFDDVYICDATGSIRNDILGPQKVYTLLASGNGNSSQFVGSDADSTDNYLLVDEADTDDDTTYVESSTATERDDYAFGDLPDTLTQINGVAINALAKKDDAGARTLDLYTRISATNYDAALDATLAESYTNHQYIWEQNPDDAADWANADVDGANFGIEVAS